MDIEALRRSPVGRLVPIRGSHRGVPFEWWAFIPAALPDAVDLRPETVHALEGAAMALARLAAAAERLPNPALLARSSVREEGVSTSAIEGTYAELPELLEAEVAESQSVPANVDETLRYVRAHERATARLRDLPLCMRLLCEAHAELTRDDPRVPSSECGSVRVRQNMIGRQDLSPVEADHVPPPPGDDLTRVIDEWESWLHRANEIPLLVRAALAHYQFEVIHPFVDGNGRIGRLLIALLLHERGALAHPVMNISPYLESSREKYVQHLADIPITGDFDPWVRFFLRGIAIRSEVALGRVEALAALATELVGETRASGLRGVARDIAASLIGYPVITPKLAKELFGVSYQAANSAIARLVDIGVLREITGRTYGRLFVAPRVIDLLTGGAS